jgi:hypothetical protein
MTLIKLMNYVERLVLQVIDNGYQSHQLCPCHARTSAGIVVACI